MNAFRKIGDALNLKDLEIVGDDREVPDWLKNPYGSDAGCEKCKESGGVGVIINPDGARPCECKLEYFAKEAEKQTGIPHSMANWTLENYPTGEKHTASALRHAKEFCDGYESGSRGIVLSGRPGTGKTRIAVSIINHLCKSGVKCRFFYYADILKELMRFSDEQAIENFWFDNRDVAVMVIDDFAGEERTSPWVQGVAMQIIDARIRHSKTTIITTNRSLTELDEKYDVSLTSRIAGVCDIWNLPGDAEDFRWRDARVIKF